MGTPQKRGGAGVAAAPRAVSSLPIRVYGFGLNRTKIQLWLDWFWTRVETFDSRNSNEPATVTCECGTKPLEMLDAAPLLKTPVVMTSPTLAAAQSTTVELDALPWTTKAATRELVELIVGWVNPPTEIDDAQSAFAMFVPELELFEVERNDVQTAGAMMVPTLDTFEAKSCPVSERLDSQVVPVEMGPNTMELSPFGYGAPAVPQTPRLSP